MGSGGKKTELTGSAKGMTELAGSVQGTTTTAKAVMLKSNGKSENSPNLGSIEQINSGQIGLKTDMQETAAQPGVKISDSKNIVQIKAGKSEQSKQGITASNDKMEDQSDSIDNTLETAVYQGQLQSSGTTDATEVNQLTQPVGNTEAYSQIKDEILATLEQKGPTEFKMKLQPESLGQIDISLKISEGKLIIDILADKSQTQALLTSQVDKLISSMGLQNVHVESVQVSQQMNSDSQNNQNQGYQMNSGMDFSQGRQNSREAGEGWQQISTGIFGTQTDFNTEETVKEIQQARDSFSRMDYII